MKKGHKIIFITHFQINKFYNGGFQFSKGIPPFDKHVLTFLIIFPDSDPRSFSHLPLHLWLPVLEDEEEMSIC